jgi:hypothetical protein
MLTPEQVQEIAAKVGTEAAAKIKTDFEAAEQRINSKLEDSRKGLMTQEDFTKFKSEELNAINEKLAEIAKLEGSLREQGLKLEEIGAKTKSNERKSLDDYIKTEIAPKIKELKGQTKPLIVTLDELKAAGIQSISGTIEPQSNVPSSPYLPGIGTELEIFDVLRNPNFITTRVDVGSTNQRRLAWANETVYEGAPAEVAEGQEKPQIEHRFKVEMSEAKKMAAWFKITEELEEDAPQLATKLRRLLESDVIRGFDDAIQAAVIASATPYVGGLGLNGAVDKANYWDAVLAMHAQVKVNNFPMVNTTAMHPFTSLAMQASKSTDDYWNPPFKDAILRTLVEANKLDPWKVLVGDLTQYKVDIYKQLLFKIGWVNDDFIKNQFVVLAEMRYHRYISDSRKKAIVYHDVRTVRQSIDTASS